MVMERTLAMNLGLAKDDMTVAPAINRRAREKDLGSWLTWYEIRES